MISTTAIDVVPIAPEHVEGYHRALDRVARERKYLTLLEAFPLLQTREFVQSLVEKGDPVFVALFGSTSTASLRPSTKSCVMYVKSVFLNASNACISLIISEASIVTSRYAAPDRLRDAWPAKHGQQSIA
jgi:hypothetical protein